jgi:hypothetical protein
VASAILFLPAAEILRLAGAEPGFATTNTGCDFSRILAHRAFCAAAIFRRADADIVRFAGAEAARRGVPTRRLEKSD